MQGGWCVLKQLHTPAPLRLARGDKRLDRVDLRIDIIVTGRDHPGDGPQEGCALAEHADFPHLAHERSCRMVREDGG
jgi:hypothetical protein